MHISLNETGLRRVKAKHITQENFEPYGIVIDVPEGVASVLTERSDYWPLLAEYHCRSGKMMIGLSCFFRRPFRLSNMERHLRTQEIMMPLNGCVVIAFAVNKTMDPSETPEYVMDAFAIPHGKVVVLKTGVWHWTPMALVDRSSVIVAFDKGTDIDDVIQQQLPPSTMNEIDVSDVDNFNIAG